MESNIIKITLLHGCSSVNLLHIFRTVSHKNTSRELLLNIVTNKRDKGDRKIHCNRNYVYLLFDIFLFRIVLTEKCKCIKAIEDDFYHKLIEVKCSGSFKLKAGHTAKENRVWCFCVNKIYCIKDIISKINGEKEKRIVCTKYFFFMFLKHAQRITEVAARRCFV